MSTKDFYATNYSSGSREVYLRALYFPQEVYKSPMRNSFSSLFYSITTKFDTIFLNDQGIFWYVTHYTWVER